MIWAVILGCWIISFVFAGVEAGLLGLDPVRLRALAKQKHPGARRLERLQKNPERLLVTVLLITNLTNIIALMALTTALVRRFGNEGFIAAVGLALPIYLLLLSVLPKNLFRRLPPRALASLATLLETTQTILAPVLWIGGKVGRFLTRRRGEPPRLFAAREELKQITEQSELTATERKMIQNVVDFTGVKARDVMVPLGQVVSVNPSTPVDEVLRLSRERDVDRMPVIDGTGQPVGIVSVLDILYDRDRPSNLNRYLRRIILAPDSEPAYRLIQRLRAARLSLAGVTDRRKQLLGIVTAEDMIRRLMQTAA